jgi:hypothetical protein
VPRLHEERLSFVLPEFLNNIALRGVFVAAATLPASGY